MNKYRQHVLGLLATHRLALAESAETIQEALVKGTFDPTFAWSAPACGTVQCWPVQDEASYAIAMHEIGHRVARVKVGVGYDPRGARRLSLMAAYDLLTEEHAAWEWAERAAVEWTPTMAHLRQLAMTTYLQLLADVRRREGV